MTTLLVVTKTEKFITRLRETFKKVDIPVFYSFKGDFKFSAQDSDGDLISFTFKPSYDEEYNPVFEVIEFSEAALAYDETLQVGDFVDLDYYQNILDAIFQSWHSVLLVPQMD